MQSARSCAAAELHSCRGDGICVWVSARSIMHLGFPKFNIWSWICRHLMLYTVPSVEVDFAIEMSHPSAHSGQQPVANDARDTCEGSKVGRYDGSKNQDSYMAKWLHRC